MGVRVEEELDDMWRDTNSLARDQKTGRELGFYHPRQRDIGKGCRCGYPPALSCATKNWKSLREGLEFRGGYQRVATAASGEKPRLYYRTGHLPYYADKMYPVMEVKEQAGAEEVREAYVLRPMNCPHHHKVYAAVPRSYRDLPLRLAEYGQVYRWEDSGAVGGLLRVRGMCMNDAHIYCTAQQVKDKFKAVMALYMDAYRISV